MLTTQQKLKLQTKCEEGLQEPHFDFLSHENSTDLRSLKSLYLVRMKVKDLRQSLTLNDMHGVLCHWYIYSSTGRRKFPSGHVLLYPRVGHRIGQDMERIPSRRWRNLSGGELTLVCGQDQEQLVRRTTREIDRKDHGMADHPSYRCRILQAHHELY